MTRCSVGSSSICMAAPYGCGRQRPSAYHGAMTPLLVALASAVAVAAAMRSTWSPCGLSMLSTITPIGERGRNNRYYTTAAWFIVGAVLGGATLGAGAALLAAGVDALDLSGGSLAGMGASDMDISGSLREASRGVKPPGGVTISFTIGQFLLDIPYLDSVLSFGSRTLSSDMPSPAHVLA